MHAIFEVHRRLRAETPEYTDCLHVVAAGVGLVSGQ